MAGINYDYDPFSLPVQGMKVPEWVMSSEAPVDAFAIADNVKKQQMLEKANELNNMQTQMKLLDMLKAQQAQNALSQIAQENQGLAFPELSKKMMEASLASGDVDSALKFGNILMNTQKNADSQEQKERDRELRRQLAEQENAINMSRLANSQAALEARIANMNDNLALRREMQQFNKDKEEKAQTSLSKNIDLFDTSQGKKVSVNPNDENVKKDFQSGRLRQPSIAEQYLDYGNYSPNMKVNLNVDWGTPPSSDYKRAILRDKATGKEVKGWQDIKTGRLIPIE